MPSLPDLQEGDQVILRQYTYTRQDGILIKHECLSVAEVEHATDTQVIVADTRFRKRDGCKVGSGLYPDTIEIPTPETLRQARCAMARRTFLRILTDVQWETLDALTLGKVCAILKQAGALRETGCTE